MGPHSPRPHTGPSGGGRASWSVVGFLCCGRPATRGRLDGRWVRVSDGDRPPPPECSAHGSFRREGVRVFPGGWWLWRGRRGPQVWVRWQATSWLWPVVTPLELHLYTYLRERTSTSASPQPQGLALGLRPYYRLITYTCPDNGHPDCRPARRKRNDSISKLPIEHR